MMYKNILGLTVVLILVFSCNHVKKNNRTENALPEKRETVRLEKVWTCDTLLKTPESVLYDVKRQRLYVSNISTGPWDKNGDGFISVLSLDGKVLNAKWIEGLNSPKGMGLVDSILYVADIDRVVKVDIAGGKIEGEIDFPDEDGLNDITIGDNGEVFVSSSSHSRVYRIKNDVPEIIVTGEDVRFNGLFAEGERLYIITSKTGQLLDYDLDTEKLDTLVSGLGQGDGLQYLSDGCFLTSDWQGEVFYVYKNGDIVSVLKTKDKKVNSADIEWIQDKNLLLVPTFFDNKVIAYSLEITK